MKEFWYHQNRIESKALAMLFPGYAARRTSTALNDKILKIVFGCGVFPDNHGFVTGAVLTSARAIGANLAMFRVIDAVMLKTRCQTRDYVPLLLAVPAARTGRLLPAATILPIASSGFGY